jgi:intracellular sulfur oxidation DsrE/DsrF family protein
MLAFVAALPGAAWSADRGEREAGRAVFHVTLDNPAALAVHLGVIERTREDLAARDTGPDLAVVFTGRAVRHLGEAQDGQAGGQDDVHRRIAAALGRLADQGVRLEVCGLAMDAFGVDPGTLLPGLEAVENGYLPLMDYQRRGYSLIPVY